MDKYRYAHRYIFVYICKIKLGVHIKEKGGSYTDIGLKYLETGLWCSGFKAVTLK